MSIRANSLQSVVLDGIYFTALMGLAAATLTTVARGADPQVVAPTEATDRRLTDDHIDSQLNTDDNRASGDPEESPAAKREAMMLGMKLYEQRTGHIMVTDVATKSPAWDAGIRAGDRLLSIDTLRPMSLAPWVTDIGKVLKDTPDGRTVAAAVERDGERLAFDVRLPVSKAGEARDALQEEEAIAEIAAAQAQQQPMQQQGAGVMPGGDDTGAVVVPGGGGGVVGIDVGGFGDGGYDDGSGNSQQNENRVAQTAMAQLMGVNRMPRGTAEEQAGQMQNPRGAGGQVGVATFEDTGEGVNVDVLVRGLPRGTYRVGIGQGDGMTGGIGNNTNVGNGYVDDGFVDDGFGGDGFGNDGSLTDAERNGAGVRDGGRQFNNRANNRGNIRNPQRAGRGGIEPLNNGGQPMPNAAPNGLPGAAGTVPAGGGVGQGGVVPGSGAGGAGGAAGGGAAGGDAGGASLADPNGSGVLAQQLDAQSGQGISQGNQGVNQGIGQGNTGNMQRPGNLQSGSEYLNRNNANGRMSNGQINNNVNNNGMNRNATNGLNTNGMNSSMGAPPFVAEIGVLQVGADSSARVQNRLEGMQVQSLAGMSVIVVSDMGQLSGGNTLGSGGAMNPNGRQAVGRQNNQLQGTQNIQGQGQANQMQGQQVGQLPNQSGAAPGVVATGVIQINDGRRTPNLEAERRTPGSGQPVDRATQEQRDRVPFSDPRQDFNPATAE
jgi:hypothetical protein